MVYDGQETTGTSTLIGVAICVAGNTCISLALNVQKLAHTRLERQQRRRPATSSTSSAPTKQLQRPSLLPRLSNGPSNSRHLLSPSEHTPLLPTSSRPQLEQSISDPELDLRSATPNLVLIPASSIDSPTTVVNSRSPSPVPLKRTSSSTDTERSSSDGPRTDKAFIKSPLWLLGFSLLILGEFGNFLSYSFAPASLVAPLGSVALVANVGLAPLICREPFHKRDLFGCALAALGAVTIVWASKAQDKKLFPPEMVSAISSALFIAYSVASVVAILVLITVSRSKYGDRYVMIDLGICALSGAFTVLSTKAISSFLNLLFLQTFQYWITYPLLVVLAGSAMLQINFINKALQRFDSRVVIPCQFMSFALSTIVGSAVLYREFDGVDLSSFLNFVFGCITCGAGVFLLTRDSPTDSSDSKKSKNSKKKGSTFTQSPRLRPTRSGSSTVINSELDLPIASSSSWVVDSSGLEGAGSRETTMRARKLSLTLGGTQYLLAHSPGTTTGGSLMGERARLRLNDIESPPPEREEEED